MDRKKKMIDQFEREGLDVEFIEAVDAMSITEVFDIRPGEFGNISSHRKIWIDMIEKGHEMALVFEDQCRLKKGFSNLVSKIEFPERWDMIYLGYTGPRFFAYENESIDRGKPVGTWCYIISLDGAKKLVSFDPRDFWLIPDTQLAFLPIRTFYAKNKLAWRDATSKSIIGSNYIERGVLKWLVIGHWLAHVFQFWPTLEMIFIILVTVLVKRLW
jgi:GR25 family glycosyltransferase involved in LPS biosynthesis